MNDENKYDELEFFDDFVEDIADDKKENTSLSVYKKEKLIVPIESVIGTFEESFNSYYEMEGDLFPDLFRRAEKGDDVDSKTKFVALNRSSKLLTSLYLEQAKNLEKSGHKISSVTELSKQNRKEELIKNLRSFVEKYNEDKKIK